MQQLWVRIFGATVGQFYQMYWAGQDGLVWRALPPGVQKIELPSVGVSASIDVGKRFTVTLTATEDKRQLCLMVVRAQVYENDLAFHLLWEPEAQQFADGVLAWLAANFRTNYAPAPTTGEAEQAEPAGMVGADEKIAEMLEAVRGWPEAKRQGERRRNYCARYSIDESTLTKWRKALKEHGYDVPDFT